MALSSCGYCSINLVISAAAKARNRKSQTKVIAVKDVEHITHDDRIQQPSKCP